MKKLQFLAIIASAALLLASCTSTNKEGTSMGKSQKLSVCQGSWQLVLLMKGAVAQQIAVADITFTPKGDGYTISGSMGENRFTGTAVSSEGGIKVEGLGTTRRAASSKELAEFESLYAQFLGGIDSCSVKNVAGENGKLMRLENSAMNAFAEFRQISIYNTLWKLAAVNSGNAVVDVKSSATLLVEKKGAAVNTGINTANLGVKVTESANKITFSDGPMTKAAGSQEDMIIESNLMKALFAADRYSISGRSLSLYSGDTLLAEFTKQDAL